MIGACRRGVALISPVARLRWTESSLGDRLRAGGVMSLHEKRRRASVSAACRALPSVSSFALSFVWPLVRLPARVHCRARPREYATRARSGAELCVWQIAIAIAIARLRHVHLRARSLAFALRANQCRLIKHATIMHSLQRLIAQHSVCLQVAPRKPAEPSRAVGG